MSFGEKIKILRKENGLSQDQLSEKINGDGRQISRYENGKMMPSIEAVIKIAKTFNISIDYLLLEDSIRKPLYTKENKLLEKFEEIQKLEEEDKKAISQLIDSLIKKAQFTKIAIS